jgi:tungstate transport system permease protein
MGFRLWRPDRLPAPVNAGPLGVLQLLYMPGAMIIACYFDHPHCRCLTRQTCEDLLEEYRDQPAPRSVIGGDGDGSWDGRYRLITAVLVGFGCAISSGAVMIVGGNIDHVTRT